MTVQHQFGGMSVNRGYPWFIFWIGDQMVLVVVTKVQQEALIPLAPVQKQCTGMRASNKCSADFSALDSFWSVIKDPITSTSSADMPDDPCILAKFPS